MSIQHQNISPSRRPCSLSSSHRKALHIPEIIRDHIRFMVDKNDLEGASNLLLELSEIFAPERVNEVIILRRGITDIEAVARMNTQDFGVISRERNCLGLAILELTDLLCG